MAKPRVAAPRMLVAAPALVRVPARAFGPTLLALAFASASWAAPSVAPTPLVSEPVFRAVATTQTEADAYTRYELLAPETQSFRITYEVSATTPGATAYYNPIRKGSRATDERVLDAYTGRPLPFTVVSGAKARRDPLLPDADRSMQYIRVELARPVPADGQARLVIEKTYRDPKSYRRDGDAIVFDRALGVQRNKVVLPPGYQVVGLTVPAQVLTEPDGRVAIAFMHAGAGTAPLVIRAVPGARVGDAGPPTSHGERRSWEAPYEGLPESARLAERAHQDRDIVYFLQRPETHAFRLYHDYTESRPGVRAYANVVRTGSSASDPAAYVLDTGEKLAAREMSGAEFAASGLASGESPPADARVIVFPFTPVEAGRSLRLRITETYVAPASYRLEGEELVFERSLGRPRNAVVLPSDWYVAASAAPATISRLPDGRVRLEFWSDRPEAVNVLLKARRNAGR